MIPTPPKPLTWTLVEVLGVLVFAMALCFGALFYPVTQSRTTKDQAVHVKSQLREVEDRLRSRGLADDLIDELVAIQRANLIQDQTHTYFITTTFIILASGLVSLAGAGIVLWARTRAMEQRMAAILETSPAWDSPAALFANVWIVFRLEDWFDSDPHAAWIYLGLFFGVLIANVVLIGWFVRRTMRNHDLVCHHCGKPLTELNWPAMDAPDRCVSCGVELFGVSA